MPCIFFKKLKLRYTVSDDLGNRWCPNSHTDQQTEDVWAGSGSKPMADARLAMFLHT